MKSIPESLLLLSPFADADLDSDTIKKLEGKKKKTS